MIVEVGRAKTFPKLSVEDRGTTSALLLSERLDHERKPVRRNAKALKISKTRTVADEIEVATVSENGNQPVGPPYVLIGDELIFGCRADPPPGDG